jgi:hypothetical protein
VLGAAVVSVLAAALVALDTRRLSPKVALIGAGFVTVVIAVAGILDTTNKGEQVRDEFAIAADRVEARVGVGLWLVLVGGVLEAAGGLAARQPSSAIRQPGRPGGGSAAAAAR